MTQQEGEDWEWPKKNERKGGLEIKGCLGQNVLIPNQHHRELLRDFTLFPFWNEDYSPSVTQENVSRDQLLSGVEQEISVVGVGLTVLKRL